MRKEDENYPAPNNCQKLFKNVKGFGIESNIA